MFVLHFEDHIHPNLVLFDDTICEIRNLFPQQIIVIFEQNHEDDIANMEIVSFSIFCVLSFLSAMAGASTRGNEKTLDIAICNLCLIELWQKCHRF